MYVHVGEVFGELESSSQHQVIGEASEGGKGGEGGEESGRGGREDRFTATRSLLCGKVKTASLEVSKKKNTLSMFDIT